MGTITNLRTTVPFVVLVAGCYSLWAGAAAHAGDAASGREKAKTCAVCHGLDGLSLRPDTPHIAGQSEIYMRDQLEKYRAGQRTHPEMNIIARDLSDDDIADLVAYYSNIEVTVELPH